MVRSFVGSRFSPESVRSHSVSCPASLRDSGTELLTKFGSQRLRACCGSSSRITVGIIFWSKCCRSGLKRGAVCVPLSGDILVRVGGMEWKKDTKYHAWTIIIAVTGLRLMITHMVYIYMHGAVGCLACMDFESRRFPWPSHRPVFLSSFSCRHRLFFLQSLAH